MSYRLRPMRLNDISEVAQIEKRSFSLAWPASAYRRELRDNRLASYIVAQQVPDACDPYAIEGQFGQPVSLWGKVRSLLGASDEGSDEIVGDLVGYAGLWLMLDEGHITTIAVRPEHRGRGLGELLLIGLFERALTVGARWVTLEVRVTNSVAQNLYRKYGFRQEGIRKGYYSDNHEDAAIMWSEEIRSPEFQEKLQGLKASLSRRLECIDD